MKRYLFFCQLALLSTLTAQAQFTAGTDGFFVAGNTQVFIDSLTLLPSVDFTLTSQTLTISSTPIAGNPPGIARVYNLTTPVDFTGVAGFFYRASELNGNTESTLQLQHGNANFVSTTGSTVNGVQHYISNTLPLTNFTSLTAGQEDALPVNLVVFQAKRVENATMLYWQTSEEKNSDHFEVQQSEDLKKWNALGTVKAATESFGKREYSFRDIADRYGRQYYRLKMVDLDGSFAYSTIESLKLEDAGMVSAYPNPVVDKLRIGSKEALASVKVIDLTGRSVLELSKPKPGQEFSLKNYPAGTYLVKVETATGKTQILKVVKQ
ncbi:Por secretion system C-terminal sorting domain-containing protein [Dyadobacter soli]|uniref:Por secretion system C-terminal sorting domain-containing protein n=2 Tax=Dyadobacter soli TaxID=659014 RepID=A0A1G7DBF7_9BACT|nr:Por secretion system C-terminal sorting domain-containing protein [Dyadobacter soli]